MVKRIAALIRHAEYHQLADTPSAFQPFPLTDNGRHQAVHQAKLLGNTLEQNNWHLIKDFDASSLLRAWQTAEIFAQALELDTEGHIDCFDALCERSVGSVANLDITLVEAIMTSDPRYQLPPRGWKSDSHYCLPFPGAESLLDAGARVAEHVQSSMQAIEESEHTQVKLFFGHGAAFRHAAYHFGLFNLEQVKQHSMFHAQPVFIEYLPNGDWRHIAGEWKLRQAKTSYTD